MNQASAVTMELLLNLFFQVTAVADYGRHILHTGIVKLSSKYRIVINFEWFSTVLGCEIIWEEMLSVAREWKLFMDIVLIY